MSFWVRSTAFLLLLSFAGASSLRAEPAEREEGQIVVEKYVQATAKQREFLRSVSMEAEFSGRLVKWSKVGSLKALRLVSDLGKVAYRKLSAEGDSTVQKEVIIRFMSTEAQPPGDASRLAITPDNYKFKYKGMRERDRLAVHVFEVSPRRKEVGLFKGEIWIDAQTYMPVHEEGRFVKSPSVFLKKLAFSRDYEIVEGVAVPKRYDGYTDTRLAGRAELTVTFSHFQHGIPDPPVPATEAVR